ncbi:hypothetical protein MAC_06235 [Metarhizium acridum CQMa 102]|uniref:Uncharacterized protein n=1 Tax=Metarhizium acridum (strain CQMa 102) TaxID=655827 RepID=E9E8M0_METAQ|nr:uncharacterized protein MAC_06235 [Metarhizium acridum CQMa 102]EFY87749.1 hypothetical protein MAC_06235 [Metarhizium acridum CQMa 102]
MSRVTQSNALASTPKLEPSNEPTTRDYRMESKERELNILLKRPITSATQDAEEADLDAKLKVAAKRLRLLKKRRQLADLTRELKAEERGVTQEGPRLSAGPSATPQLSLELAASQLRSSMFEAQFRTPIYKGDTHGALKSSSWI